MRRKNIKDILPFYPMSMLIAKESSSSVCIPLPVILNDSSLKDVLSGFAAGATGTAMNCWTDVPTLGRSISGSLDSPVAGFRMLDVKNFPLH